MDERDIRDVKAADLEGYGQIHLFAGIGGFAYAARLAGWPDGRSVLTGGFPCQDVSFAGKRAGFEGERTSLWSEIRRLLGELRTEVAILENVPGLLSLGLGRVLGDLSEIGFDAVWDCIPACAVSAPHRRDRFWAIAYPNDNRHGIEIQHVSESRRCATSDAGCDGATQPLADPNDAGLEGWDGRVLQECSSEWIARTSNPSAADPACDTGNGTRQNGASRSLAAGRCHREFRAGEWEFEPGIRRVADGVPKRVDRLKALGNAIVPQVAEQIFRAIMASDEALAA